jgi:hypothetical protein
MLNLCVYLSRIDYRDQVWALLTHGIKNIKFKGQDKGIVDCIVLVYLGSQICNVTMINFFLFFSEMLNLSQKKLTKNDGQHIVFIVPTVKSAFSLYQHVASSSTRLFVDSSLLFLRVDRQDKMLHKDIIQEILNGKLRKLWKVLFKILIRITRLTLRERGKKKEWKL